MINRIDEKKIPFRFNKAAKTYDQVAVLQQLVGKALLDRLQGIRYQPQTILDLGCGTGYMAAYLKINYPKAKIIGLDKATGMLKQAITREKKAGDSIANWVSGCAENLPFNDNSFELVYSNLVLHWSVDFNQSLKEIHRILKPGGLLLFSMVGPDTLKELRCAWGEVDDKSHVHMFADMHDVGDSLLQIPFADPVMDVDYFTLLYSDPIALMKELKALGVQNLAIDRPRSLTTKGALKKLLQSYGAFRNASGKFPATWEIIYGHAWLSDEVVNEKSDFNEIKIPIHSIRKQIKQ